MKYAPESIEGRFLRGDSVAIGTVSRWISTVLTDLRYWGLLHEWSDLHQDALAGVVASLRRERFDPRRDFRAYVMAVARFTVRHSVRHPRRRHEADPAVPIEWAPDSAASTESVLLRGLVLRRALAGLSPACRELISAYFFEQRDAEEIATTQNIPVGTVKSRLFRCLEGVRRELRRLSDQRTRP